jgi:hypothetical protein
MPAPKIRFRVAIALWSALGCGVVAAEEAPAGADAPPTRLEWRFGADLIGAGFANSNAYFGESQSYLGDEIGQWSEWGLEPQASFRMPAGVGTAFGGLSVVATNTLGNDASGLTVGIQDASEVTLEQAHLGWTATEPFDAFEGETLTVTIGNLDYSIGSGLIVDDGGSDGGEHGGWYLGMRKAFREALLVQLETEALTLEGFRLANRPRAGGTQGDLLGVNGEFRFRPDHAVGVSVLSVDTTTNSVDRLLVLSGRFDRAPATGFGVSAELVSERNQQIEASGGFAQVSYAPPAMRWSPTFAYRYAAFSGDDPATAIDERFREVAYGYTDYGTWYQGEVTGNYPLGNGNLRSHMLRMTLAPRETVTVNLIYYRFSFDEPASFGATSDDWGDELDLTIDWEVDDRLSLAGVLRVLAPGRAATEIVGGDDEWLYTMLSAAYAW